MLFLDVDGPLIPFGGPDPHRTHAPAPPPGSHPLLARLDPAHGSRLTALGCELVWATTWGPDANDSLAPRLGLPPLPVVEWSEDEDPADAAAGLHWKTRALSTWATGRPYAWLDDEIRAPDHAWTDAHHPKPTLLRRVNPCRGLTGADYAAVAEWVRSAHPDPAGVRVMRMPGITAAPR
ncbi:HAD domain-containing protein [Streptomyces sp. NPDC020422]|uniref:HAD domain-containing protein n=1 Tax=Streptomyces sp. NPDC020422 TaxID=3365074 RepID=UPI00379F1FE4